LSKKKATGIRLRCVFGPSPLARRAWRFEDPRVANRRRSSLLSAFAPSFRRSRLTVFVSVSFGVGLDLGLGLVRRCLEEDEVQDVREGRAGNCF